MWMIESLPVVRCQYARRFVLNVRGGPPGAHLVTKGSVQASTVYQFQSIEILQYALDPILIFAEFVVVGGLEVVMEDMSISRY
jgi:hypothetical protein